MPGRPPSATAPIPESSAIVASPVASWTARALSSAIAAKLSPSSGGSSTPSGRPSNSTPGSSSRISRSLCLLPVAKIKGSSAGYPLLHLAQPGDAHLGEAEQLVKRGTGEWRLLRRRLHLDQTAVAGHHHVGVDFGVGFLAVVEIAERPAVDHADTDCRN